MNTFQWIIVGILAVAAVLILVGVLGSRRKKEEFLSATQDYPSSGSPRLPQPHAGTTNTSTSSTFGGDDIGRLLAQASDAPIVKIGIPPVAHQDIQKKVDTGDTVGAVKRLREATGMSLKDATQAVRSWNTLQFEDTEPGNSSYLKQNSSAGEPSLLTQEALDLIEEQLKQGQIIQAIKTLRLNSNLGLKEAKDAVDQWVENGGVIPRS